MAWFSRKNNQDYPKDYLKATDTVSRPMGVFSSLLVGLLVACAVLAVYFGGRWLYNRINTPKNETPSTTSSDTNKNNSGNSNSSGNNSDNSTGSQANGQNTSTTDNNSANTNGNSSSSSTQTKVPDTAATPGAPLPSTGASPEVIPNTGPDPNYNY